MSDTPLATRILVMLLIPLWFPLVLLGTWIAYRLEKKGYLLPNGRKE